MRKPVINLFLNLLLFLSLYIKFIRYVQQILKISLKNLYFVTDVVFHKSSAFERFQKRSDGLKASSVLNIVIIGLLCYKPSHERKSSLSVFAMCHFTDT